jgi:hypothetical protein
LFSSPQIGFAQEKRKEPSGLQGTCAMTSMPVVLSLEKELNDGMQTGELLGFQKLFLSTPKSVEIIEWALARSSQSVPDSNSTNKDYRRVVQRLLVEDKTLFAMMRNKSQYRCAASLLFAVVKAQDTALFQEAVVGLLKQPTDQHAHVLGFLCFLAAGFARAFCYPCCSSPSPFTPTSCSVRHVPRRSSSPTSNKR